MSNEPEQKKPMHELSIAFKMTSRLLYEKGRGSKEYRDSLQSVVREIKEKTKEFKDFAQKQGYITEAYYPPESMNSSVAIVHFNIDEHSAEDLQAKFKAGGLKQYHIESIDYFGIADSPDQVPDTRVEPESLKGHANEKREMGK